MVLLGFPSLTRAAHLNRPPFLPVKAEPKSAFTAHLSEFRSSQYRCRVESFSKCRGSCRKPADRPTGETATWPREHIALDFSPSTVSHSFARSFCSSLTSSRNAALRFADISLASSSSSSSRVPRPNILQLFIWSKLTLPFSAVSLLPS